MGLIVLGSWSEDTQDLGGINLSFSHESVPRISGLILSGNQGAGIVYVLKTDTSLVAFGTPIGYNGDLAKGIFFKCFKCKLFASGAVGARERVGHGVGWIFVSLVAFKDSLKKTKKTFFLFFFGVVHIGAREVGKVKKCPR